MLGGGWILGSGRERDALGLLWGKAAVWRDSSWELGASASQIRLQRPGEASSHTDVQRTGKDWLGETIEAHD